MPPPAPEIEPLETRVKIGYGLGDFSVSMGVNVAAIYLLYYFTDVFMIQAYAAGMILLVGRMGLGFIDPVIGGIVDRTRTRWGNRRPYLLFGAVPLGLAHFLLFASPAVPEELRTAYGFITFTFFFLTVSLVNIPYTSLLPALTMDSGERSVLAGYKVFFALIGAIIAAGATKPFVHFFSSELVGFRVMGLTYGVIMAAGMLVTFFAVKERIRPETGDRPSMIKSFGIIRANRPFLLLAGATVLFDIAMMMLAGVVNYYFKYNLSAENMIPAAFLSLFSVSALCTPLYVRISNRVSKKFAYNLGMGIFGLTLVAVYFVGEISPIVTILLLVVAGLGMAPVFLSPWAMVPDTVEYNEWQSGKRLEGTLYGYFFFSWKMAAALSGFLVGLGLDVSGYLPNAAQTARALFGLRLMMSLIPAAFIGAGMILLSRYPIDRETHQSLVEEIRARQK